MIAWSIIVALGLACLSCSQAATVLEPTIKASVDTDNNNCLANTLVSVGISEQAAQQYALLFAQHKTTLQNLRSATDFTLRVVGIAVQADADRILRCFGHSSGTVPIKNCTARPVCSNRGQCLPSNPAITGASAYECSCQTGYSGAECEQDICSGHLPSSSNSISSTSAPTSVGDRCQHGGVCSRTQTAPGFRCSCADGYTGLECEEVVDNCASQPCRHGARCESGVNQFKCHCKVGYAGPLCEEKWLTKGRREEILDHLNTTSHRRHSNVMQALSSLTSLVTNLAQATDKTLSTMSSMHTALTNLDMKFQRFKLDHFKYNLFTETGSWLAALRKCKSYGGTLANARTPLEYRRILVSPGVQAHLSSGGHIWLGGNDRAREGRWVWTDGTPITFNAWNTGEPNNHRHNEDCATMLIASGQMVWNDGYCGASLSGYICEF